MLSRALRTAAVPALAAIAAATLSERPARAQTAQTVEPGRRYIPSGVSAGPSFRLQFVASARTAAAAASIPTCNGFAQARGAPPPAGAGRSPQVAGAEWADAERAAAT